MGIALLFPIVYLVTPFTALIEDYRLRYVVFLTILLTKAFAGIISFPCMTIMLTNSAPSLKVLGTLNGFATTFSGLGRAAGPAMTGAAFTWGLQRGYIITGWWLLAFIAALGAIPPFLFDEPGGFFTDDASDTDESDDDNDDEDADDHIVVFEDAIGGDSGKTTLRRKSDVDDLIDIRRRLTPSPMPGDEADADLRCPPALASSRGIGGGRRRDYGSTSPVPFVRLRSMSSAGEEVEGGRAKDEA